MSNGERFRTAREKVILHGLIDWVSLSHIHTYVKHEIPGAPLGELQNESLSLLRSLVSDGLYELGDLSGKGGSFVAWDGSLDESMRRVEDLYITHYGDMARWPWEIWLNLTEEGNRVARSFEDDGEDSHG